MKTTMASNGTTKAAANIMTKRCSKRCKEHFLQNNKKVQDSPTDTQKQAKESSFKICLARQSKTKLGEGKITWFKTLI